METLELISTSNKLRSLEKEVLALHSDPPDWTALVSLLP